MYFLYSLVLTLGFILLSPWFLFDAIFYGKYAPGFFQRLGFVSHLEPNGKPVIWLHCVSVGEINAARTLVTRLTERFPEARLVVSTTTRAGQKLARSVFADTAARIFYFPFDWRSTVKRTLKRINPSVVLLMETEIWFNFIRETSKHNSRIAIINGRLSPTSFKRYGYIKKFVRRVLGYLDVALMQEKTDATRLMSLGLRASKVKVTGNLKFDHELDERESELTERLRSRFSITAEAPIIIAASTHAPEERYMLEALSEIWKSSGANLPRLIIAPRHPERFDEVANLIKKTGFSWARLSEMESSRDKAAEVILIDTIGDLRSAYPLAEIVFVGGSLVQHGGQSIFEPAAAGRSIMTGPHTVNFAVAVEDFVEHDALIQLPRVSENSIVSELVTNMRGLLENGPRRASMGRNAAALMENNRGAVERTLEYLSPLICKRGTSKANTDGK